MVDVIFIIAAVIFCAVLIYVFIFDDAPSSPSAEEEVGKLRAESKQSENERLALIALNTQSTTRILELEAQLRKTVSQKKSSEVRTGLIAEQMAPFLEGFPYDPKSAVFLGRPLDFVVFDEDGIHFVEVKSGNAQLSSKQRMLRDSIRESRVTFEVYRIKGE